MVDVSPPPQEGKDVVDAKMMTGERAIWWAGAKEPENWPAHLVKRVRIASRVGSIIVIALFLGFHEQIPRSTYSYLLPTLVFVFSIPEIIYGVMNKIWVPSIIITDKRIILKDREVAKELIKSFYKDFGKNGSVLYGVETHDGDRVDLPMDDYQSIKKLIETEYLGM